MVGAQDAFAGGQVLLVQGARLGGVARRPSHPTRTKDTLQETERRDYHAWLQPMTPERHSVAASPIGR